jgi:hypothetical protein
LNRELVPISFHATLNKEARLSSGFCALNQYDFGLTVRLLLLRILGLLGLNRIFEIVRGLRSGVRADSADNFLKLTASFVKRCGGPKKDFLNDCEIEEDLSAPNSDFTVHEERRTGITGVRIASVPYDAPERRILTI